MEKAPERRIGEDGLPVPPYSIYNIGNNSPENLLDFVTILQEELVKEGVLPKDYDFKAHKNHVNATRRCTNNLCRCKYIRERF